MHNRWQKDICVSGTDLDCVIALAYRSCGPMYYHRLTEMPFKLEILEECEPSTSLTECSKLYKIN